MPGVPLKSPIGLSEIELTTGVEVKKTKEGTGYEKGNLGAKLSAVD